MKHLVVMATSEHMIMQNEALVALGLIAGLDLGKSQGVRVMMSQCSQILTTVLATWYSKGQIGSTFFNGAWVVFSRAHCTKMF